MELASVRIFVSDVPAAARFYADVVGLEQVGSAPDVALFGSHPQIVIEAADAEAYAEGLVGRFTGVSFATEDAGALHRAVDRCGRADARRTRASGVGRHLPARRRPLRQHHHIPAVAGSPGEGVRPLTEQAH